MKTTVGVHEAKDQLSRLLRRVELGEEVVITRNGEPVAKLVKVEPPGDDAGPRTTADDIDRIRDAQPVLFEGADDSA